VPASLPEDLLRELRERAGSENPSDFEPMPPQRPAGALSQRELARAEQELGFPLAAALHDVYGLVANGGFGPGYGLIGLVGGVVSDLGKDVVDEYRMRVQLDAEDPEYFWPAGVLPLCHWGCAIYSCVDCRTPEASVIRFDPNPVGDDWSIAWGLESPSLTHWLGRWLAGEELFESGTPNGSFVIRR
jgi:hypothetical protein